MNPIPLLQPAYRRDDRILAGDARHWCCAFAFAAGLLMTNPAVADEGAAAGASAAGSDNGIDTCQETLGTIRLEDKDTQSQVQAQTAQPQGGGGLFGGGLASMLTRILTGGGNAAPPQSTVNVSMDSLRVLIGESACFIIVERSGAGDKAAASERERVRSKDSEIRDNSNFQSGQEIAADYALVAHLEAVGSDSKFNFGLGGLLPARLFDANASTSLSSADVLLVLDDIRTNAQLAVARGHGEARNLDLAGGVLGKLGALGGGENIGMHMDTPNGKLILQAYADAYKRLVKALKNYKMQTVRAAGGPGTGGALKMQGAQPDPSGKGQPNP